MLVGGGSLLPYLWILSARVVDRGEQLYTRNWLLVAKRHTAPDVNALTVVSCQCTRRWPAEVPTYARWTFTRSLIATGYIWTRAWLSATRNATVVVPGVKERLGAGNIHGVGWGIRVKGDRSESSTASTGREGYGTDGWWQCRGQPRREPN